MTTPRDAFITPLGRIDKRRVEESARRVRAEAARDVMLLLTGGGRRR